MKKSKIENVGRFYDRLDRVYLGLWGESLHHGLWLSPKMSREDALRAMDLHLAELAALRGLENGTRVLDVGCGYGESGRFWGERFGVKVDGVTISEKQAMRAREMLSGMVFCEDWHDWHGGEEKYERVFCVESFSHSTRPQAFLRNLSRVLKNHGRLVIADWGRSSRISRIEGFFLKILAREGGLVWRSDEEICEELSQAGFRVLSHEEVGRRVARTWLVMASRGLLALRKSGFLRALVGVLWRRPFLLVTPFLAYLLYQTGALRYGIRLAEIDDC